MSDLSPQEREILNQVKLGIAGERFIESPLGGEIIKRAQMDHDDAMSELMDVDPNDALLIRDIQNRARLPIMLLQYLNDIVEEGRQAEKLISGEE
jgi:hypothetical protein